MESWIPFICKAENLPCLCSVGWCSIDKIGAHLFNETNLH